MNPSLETVWRELRPHLEWADGFNLVLLFADQPAPVETLRDRLDVSLHWRTLRLRVLDPESPTALVGLADKILTPRAGFGPLWVELWRQAEDPAWRQARTTLLHRLNERRGRLESVVRQPLVLVLPIAERSSIYALAPDLWAVRSFTAQLPGPNPTKMSYANPVIRYFVSYAHDDRHLKDGLMNPLKQFLDAANEYSFVTWDDTEILAGEGWHEMIQEAIVSCQLGLLMVSPAFLGSKYIQDHELRYFIDSNITVPGLEKRVIPVALKPIPFDYSMDLNGLEKLQFFRSKAGKTFQSCQTNNTREEFALELFQHIIKVVKRYAYYH